MIHLELLFLFRSSEVFSVIEVSSAQDPKPRQKGKGPRAVEALGFRSRRVSSLRGEGPCGPSGVQKPQGSEHERRQKLVHLETSMLESSTTLRKAARRLKELVYQITVP